MQAVKIKFEIDKKSSSKINFVKYRFQKSSKDRYKEVRIILEAESQSLSHVLANRIRECLLVFSSMYFLKCPNGFLIVVICGSGPKTLTEATICKA